MWLKHKIWMILSILLVVWFEYSDYSECYYNADESQIHVINGLEWIDLDITVEQNAQNLFAYDENHIVRRSISYTSNLFLAGSDCLNVVFKSFLLCINTTQKGLDNDSKPIYFDLQDWLYLKYLF